MEETGGQAASVFGAATLTRPLRPHQQRALAAFETDRQRGNAATYLVVPPGGGKTLIGLEVARRLGRPTVVLCPNTVIQAQWIAQWQTAFAPVTVTATASREVPTALTVLTYQAVSTLDQGGNGGGLGGDPEAGGAGEPGAAAAATRGGAAGKPGPARPDGDELLSLLHPNGLALIERLCAGGPWTLVLDECHHLLELWGRLLRWRRCPGGGTGRRQLPRPAPGRAGRGVRGVHDGAGRGAVASGPAALCDPTADRLPAAGLWRRARLAVRRLVIGHVPATIVYHAVPSVLAGKKQPATQFERAWNARVSPGTILYTGSPEGAGILTVQRGDDPFAVTTQIRTLWR